MQIIKICLYIALGVLVIWYVYTLSSNKKRTSLSFGKKKIVLKIVNKYPNITPRATRQLDSVVKELGNHFFENGEVNYELMLDTLMQIKNNQNDVDDKVVHITNIIEGYIRKEKPFLHISDESGALFRKLSNDIEKKDYSTASKDLNLLYEKMKEVEVRLRKRSRRDFCVGTTIGIIGIAISIITSIMN